MYESIKVSTREPAPSQTLVPVVPLPPPPPVLVEPATGVLPPDGEPLPPLLVLPVPPALVPLPAPAAVLPVPPPAVGREASELPQATLATAPTTSNERRTVLSRFKIRIFSPSIFDKHHCRAVTARKGSAREEHPLETWFRIPIRTAKLALHEGDTLVPNVCVAPWKL
jgi:hypothetical protein